jgi:protein-S-isoprenylcysteine O-methyltransferase Ste14
MQSLLGTRFKYYRLYYSVFAIIYLIPLLYLQYTIDSIRLWSKNPFIEFPGVLMIIAGLTIMLICMRRYFFDISGVKALAKRDQLPAELQTDGLHEIVRHPLYFGTLVFIWGCFLLFPLLSNLIACCLITIYTIAGIQIEERKLIMEFGERYTYYSNKVPMLIPRLSIRKRKLREQWSEMI